MNRRRKDNPNPNRERLPPHCKIVPTGFPDDPERAFCTKAVVATVVELSPAVAVTDVI